MKAKLVVTIIIALIIGVGIGIATTKITTPAPITKTVTTTTTTIRQTITQTVTKTITTTITSTKTTTITTTAIPMIITLDMDYAILKYSFTTNESFIKEVNVGSALIYYRLKVISVKKLDKKPRLSVYFKAHSEESSWMGNTFQVDLENIKLPYTLLGDWIYIPKKCKATYKVNITVLNAEVSGELSIIKFNPPVLKYGQYYLVRGLSGFYAFKLNRKAGNLILLEKSPKGGQIEVLQRSEEYAPCFMSSFSHRYWIPTGIVVELNKVIIPSCVVWWGCKVTPESKKISGGWIEQVFLDGELLMVISTSQSSFLLGVNEITGLAHPKTAHYLKIGESIDLPVANNVEGVFLNLIIDEAPSVVTLELSIEAYRKYEFHFGANLINESGWVVSTTHGEIIPENVERVLIMLPVNRPGTYSLNLNYALPTFTKLALKIKLINIEKADLSEFEFDEEWNVWIGRIIFS